MRLYEITYNGRKWETTHYKEAFFFCRFIGLSFFNEDVDLIIQDDYTGPEIPNIQVA